MPDTVDDFNEALIEEFRANGGKVGGMFEGRDLLLLHTTGAKTGRRRVNPVAYRRDGDRVAVFGTKGGADTHPDWYHNVRAHPDASVELGSERFDVTARIAEGEERDRIWADQKAEIPAFAEYEKKTERVIPVVVLERTT
jgi:deazaflavin-dependent oxidoreductase (nitroreductase family)